MFGPFEVGHASRKNMQQELPPDIPPDIRQRVAEDFGAEAAEELYDYLLSLLSRIGG
jgi:hypothetical protein